MKVTIYRLNECSQATGLCVIIDVLRAFTTAAFAFAAGAKQIILVATEEEAFALYKKDPSLLLMGEHNGNLIQGFHHGNSPTEIKNLNLLNRSLVQRTSAGTQGVIRCQHADHLLLASFVVAEATLRHIQETSPSHVSLIVTGSYNGDEDMALAEYLKHRLENNPIKADSFLKRVSTSPAGQLFINRDLPIFPEKDLQLALQIDYFSFAMEVDKSTKLFIAKKRPRLIQPLP